jgi:hypothetical protein
MIACIIGVASVVASVFVVHPLCGLQLAVLLVSVRLARTCVPADGR